MHVKAMCRWSCWHGRFIWTPNSPSTHACFNPSQMDKTGAIDLLHFSINANANTNWTIIFKRFLLRQHGNFFLRWIFLANKRLTITVHHEDDDRKGAERKNQMANWNETKTMAEIISNDNMVECILDNIIFRVDYKSGNALFAVFPLNN